MVDPQDITARFELASTHLGNGRRIMPGVARLGTPGPSPQLPSVHVTSTVRMPSAA